MQTTRDKIITEYADKIENVKWAEGARAVNNMSDLQRLQRVNALIEEAFIIASYTHGNDDVLFTLATFAHDTDLDTAIREGMAAAIDADMVGEDTPEQHQRAESAPGVFL